LVQEETGGADLASVSVSGVEGGPIENETAWGPRLVAVGEGMVGVGIVDWRIGGETGLKAPTAGVPWSGGDGVGGIAVCGHGAGGDSVVGDV